MIKEHRKVGEISKLTGLSVRTLHYYHQIGLLIPSENTESGHRLYTKSDITRLQQILSLRALNFSLDEIKNLLSNPDLSPHAIAKMTGKSAERIGIKDRGFLKAGCWADITLFDYNLIRDNKTAQNSSAKPSGIKYVFVNGYEVVREGTAIPGKKCGQILKCS